MLTRIHQFAAALVMSSLIPTVAWAAEDAPAPAGQALLPTGEITGTTEGQGKLRVALSWRGVHSRAKNLGYVVAPSIDIALKDGSAIVFAGGGQALTPSRPINVGLTYSLLWWQSKEVEAKNDEITRDLSSVHDKAIGQCVERCVGKVAAENKAFCDAYAKDGERDAVLESLVKMQARARENGWKLDAVERPVGVRVGAESPEIRRSQLAALALLEPKADAVKADKELLERLDMLRDSTLYRSSRRSSPESETEEEAKAIKQWKDLLKERGTPKAATTAPAGKAAPAPGSTQELEALQTRVDEAITKYKEGRKTEDAGVDASIAVLRKMRREIDPEQADDITTDDLCPDGKQMVEDAEKAREYAGWWRDSATVSFGIRATGQSFSFYEKKDDVLKKDSKQVPTLSAAISAGKLWPTESKASFVMEGVVGYSRLVSASSNEIKWCQDVGSLEVNETTQLPAQQCSSGILGAPTAIDRVFATALVGALFTPSGVFKLQGGVSFEYRGPVKRGTAAEIEARRLALQGMDISIHFPLSINLADMKAKDRFKYTGVLRLVPLVRLARRHDPEQPDVGLTYQGATYLLSVQFLGQRSFWGDALSWL